jgi:hypothetical protein
MSTEILTGDADVAEAGAIAPRRRSNNPQYLSQLAEVATLVGKAFAGDRRAMLTMSESLSTSDFPKIFGDVLDRELMAQYEQISPVWEKFARRTVVRDFRPKHWLDLLGGRAVLDPVKERGEYKARALTEGEYFLTVGKYGTRLPLTWEMMVNDDLDAFRTAPERLSQAARDTEDQLATGLIASATGPNSAYFTSAPASTAGGLTPPGTGGAAAVFTGKLTTDNVTTGLTTVSTRLDSDGRPVMIDAMILMVPPSLAVIANQIINAQVIRNRVTSGSNTQDLEIGNWLSSQISVVVNPWLPIIDKSANASTTWYLLPAPSIARPALTMGFLRGYETPDLRMKADTGIRVGGGIVPAEEGSFETDDIQYRIRHVVGGTTLDPIAAYASIGTTAT